MFNKECYHCNIPVWAEAQSRYGNKPITLGEHFEGKKHEPYESTVYSVEMTPQEVAGLMLYTIEYYRECKCFKYDPDKILYISSFKDHYRDPFFICGSKLPELPFFTSDPDLISNIKCRLLSFKEKNEDELGIILYQVDQDIQKEIANLPIVKENKIPIIAVTKKQE